LNAIERRSGGPNWAGNPVDASVLLDTESRELFFLQPSFFALAHVSHFAPPGSKYISTLLHRNEEFTVVGGSSGHTTVAMEGVTRGAFLRPDGLVAVVVSNGTPLRVVWDLEAPGQGRRKLECPPYGIQTVLYQPRWSLHRAGQLWGSDAARWMFRMAAGVAKSPLGAAAALWRAATITNVLHAGQAGLTAAATARTAAALARLAAL